MNSNVVQFDISSTNPRSHIYEVKCRVETPNVNGQQFSLPTWTPGSYLIREFAKNVADVHAHNRLGPVAVQKLNKNTWACEPCEGELVLEYRVYAWDHSIRTAYLDDKGGFFNGTSVFMKPHGFEQATYKVEIAAPNQDWTISTSMKETCDGYEDLVDYPVYMGRSDRVDFDVAGIPHQLVVIGKHNGDLAKLTRDLTQLCQTHIQFFGGRAPFDRYTFLLRVEEDAYGGLEHHNSSALLTSTLTADPLLGLISHEYFHAWNVKAMRPASLLHYDFDQENYTDLLWFFEGFTAYYDDLLLLRSGLINADSYLKLLSKTITRVWQGKGRLHQSLQNASHDAWIKFYRPDENSPNAHVSYYTKGSLVALALDLKIRLTSKGERSLDDVMAWLWQNYAGKPFGINREHITQAAEEVAGISLRDFFTDMVDGTLDPDLVTLFSPFAIDCEFKSSDNWGFKTKTHDTQITFVERDSAAEQAGLAAGDILVAWNDLRITPQNLSPFLKRSGTGEVIHLHAFRRGVLFETDLTISERPLDTCHLSLAAGWEANTLAKGFLRSP